MRDLPVKVILAESAYQAIASESAKSLEVETGGLLVGRRAYYKDSPLVVVLHASGPGRAADQQTLQFSPDHKALQAELGGDKPEVVLQAIRALELMGRSAGTSRPAIEHLLQRAKQLETESNHPCWKFVRFSAEALLESL